MVKSDHYKGLELFTYSIYMTHAAILFLTTSIFMVLGKLTGSNLTPIIRSARYIDTGNIIFNYVILIIQLLIIISISLIFHKTIETSGIRLKNQSEKVAFNHTFHHNIL